MQPKVFRRALRHARTPRAWPILFRKNIKYAAAYAKYAFASRDPRYWDELGRGCAAGERYEEALACYDYALSLRSDIARIWNNRGNALRKLDRLDEAEKSLREALRLKPDFAEAQNDLGRVLLDLGRFEEAEASVTVPSEPYAASC
jgi:tetratricopeptide (TPR) repeat protein